MKKIAILLVLLCALAQADDDWRRGKALSRQDAEQLHAFLLSGELLDFAHRCGSARSYLLAAQLRLDYPTKPFEPGPVLELCRQARAVMGDDSLARGWAEELENRARKHPRGAAGPLEAREGELPAGGSLTLAAQWMAVRGDGNFQLERLDPAGKVLERTAIGGELFLTTEPGQRIRLVNRGEGAGYWLLWRGP
ncbi:MAG: hypothetical protein AB7S38_06565 [Vulcanimicrobiota bacterium]